MIKRDSLSKLWGLMLPQQRRSLVRLMGLMVVGALLEMLGVGLLLPVLGLMTQSDIETKIPAVKWLVAALGNPDRAQFIMIAMGVLVAVNGIRVIFIAFITWRQVTFTQAFIMSLAQRLYTGYLNQPYTFHLQRNSALLIRNIRDEVNFLRHAVQYSLVLGSEASVLVALTGLLFVVDPVGVSAIMMLLGGAAWWFHRLTRVRILRWGEQRQYHEGMQIQQLQQGLGGVKEVKLLGREAHFLAGYAVHNIGSTLAIKRQMFVKALPRLWFEFLAIFGMGAFVVSMLTQGQPVKSLVPSLGVFAAAAFRLMPSVNRLLGTVQGIRYGAPAINTLFSELSAFSPTSADVNYMELPFQSSIELEGIHFTYPAADSPALHGVSLSISKGLSVGFIGGSGAGKSTLIDIVLGLLTPTKGLVKVDGKDIRTNLRAWQDQVGYVPQTIYLIDDTLRRNVAFGLPEEEIDDAAVARALRGGQLEKFINSLPDGLNTLVGERGVRLSGGQRQRIGIARALYYDPPVLVLDEATSALDTATEQGVMEAVNALHGDKTLLIVAHRLSTVAHCDVIYRLESGRIVESGNATAVLASLVNEETPQVGG